MLTVFAGLFGILLAIFYLVPEPPDSEDSRQNVIKDSRGVGRPSGFLEHLQVFIPQNEFSLQDSTSKRILVRVEVGTVNDSLALRISSQMISNRNILVTSFNP